MESMIVGMLAETAVHPGSGSDTGIIDLPVSRESTTQYPVVVGSAVKGSLLSLARTSELFKGEDRDAVFGKPDQAGQLLVSDARLILLPVRSLTGLYKWVTCPYLLERYERDCKRSGDDKELSVKCPGKGKYSSASTEVTTSLFLEERSFERSGDIAGSVVEHLGELIAHEASRARLPAQLVVLSNDDFSWFARFGLSVNARNQLDVDTKESKIFGTRKRWRQTH